MRRYEVLIRCFTYNHAKYILQALRGFVSQETKFPYLIVAMDDASTDGTDSLINDYIKAEFNLNSTDYSIEETDYAFITFAHHRSNQNCDIVFYSLKYNHNKVRDKKLAYISDWRSKSKYEAICEGDDYWMDSGKLQLQVDLMEQNDDMAFCYTRTKYWYEENNCFLYDWGGPFVEFKQLLKVNTVPTLTALYRIDHMLEYYKDINPHSKSWRMGDYPMWLWFAYNYKVGFIDKVTSVYRVLNESASHSKDVEKKLGFILSSIDIQEFFANRYGVNAGIDYARLRIQAKMYNYALYGKWKLFTGNWKKLLEYGKWNLLCLFPYKYMLFFVFPRLRRKYLIH